MACRKAGLRPGRHVRLVASTCGRLHRGAAAEPTGSVGSTKRLATHVMLSSISGGTDICSAFVGGCPMVPVVAGKISCRYLGAAVEAFDDTGHLGRGRAR